MTKLTLSVSLFRVPELAALDFTQIKTWDVSRTLLFLGSGPVFSRDAYSENIYLDKYESNTDATEWRFRFRPDLRFSDNSPLMAEHWYHSIARNIRKGAGVHFNPRRDIIGAETSETGYCDGLTLNDREVKIRLKAPNKNFIELVGKTEASILPLKSAEADQLDLLSLPSAGPYKLTGYTPGRVLLEINANYPRHCNRAMIPQIEIRQLSDQEAFSARTKGDVDFVYPYENPSATVRNQLHNNSQEIPDFGHTYFLSIRSAGAVHGDNPLVKDSAFRHLLSRLLRDLPSLEGVDPCDVILIGKGLGRLSQAPSFKNDATAISRLPKITVAAVDSPISRHVVNYLSIRGLSLDVVWVDHFNKLYEGAAAFCNLMIGWNDFCGSDPYVGLYNALNPDRPLFYDDGQWRNRLTAIQNTPSETEKDELYRK